MRVPSLRRLRRPILLERYSEDNAEVSLVEQLTDEDLKRLNELLPWRCFTVDRNGRPFGGAAWHGKRVAP
jgi:hypothetical protein